MKLKPRHRCAGPRVIMRNWRSFWFAGVSAAFILIFFQVTAARAATLNVPADYATIQAAIDAAANGGFTPEYPHSPNAERISSAYYLILGFTGFIFVLVELLLVVFIWKYRTRGRGRGSPCR